VPGQLVLARVEVDGAEQGPPKVRKLKQLGGGFGEVQAKDVLEGRVIDETGYPRARGGDLTVGEVAPDGAAARSSRFAAFVLHRVPKLHLRAQVELEVLAGEAHAAVANGGVGRKQGRRAQQDCQQGKDSHEAPR